MPTYPYRCASGHDHDEFRPVSGRDLPSTCPECGESAKRMFALTRNIYSPMKLHNSFDMIAPLDDEGRAMTIGEAQRSGKFKSFNRDEEVREQSYRRSLAEAEEAKALEASKRDAWKERKVVVK